MASKACTVFNLEQRLVQNSAGLSIDIGGSSIKVLYRHKEDTESTESTKDTARVRLLFSPIEDFQEVMCYLKQNCDIRRCGDNKPVVFTTGVRCYKHSHAIEDQLNIRISPVWEADCVVRGFNYLVEQCPWRDFVYSLNEERQSEILQIQEGMRVTMINHEKPCKAGLTPMKPFNADQLDFGLTLDRIDEESLGKPVNKVLPDMYPCLILTISSDTWMLVLHADGSYEGVSAACWGGRTFLGLGSLICRIKKTYNELLDLAERGNNERVDQTMNAQLVSGSSTPQKTTAPAQTDSPTEKDIYGEIVGGEGVLNDVLYCFGDAAVKPPDSFNKEDLIRALLGLMSRDIVGYLYHSILLRDIKHVFVSGSFVKRPLVRTILQNEFARQKVMFASTFNGQGLSTKLHFIQPASQLCVLGAFLLNSKTDGHKKWILKN